MDRCHDVTNWDEVSTHWSVIQYQPGQKFTAHYDFADKPGLRRAATLLIYLCVCSAPLPLTCVIYLCVQT